MSFLDLLKHRRSIRQYKEEAVSKEALEAIVEAGLLSPSGRNIRPWELIVVQKKETLEKMSECRVGSAKNAGRRVCCDRCDRRSGKDRRMDRGLFHCYVQHAQHGPRLGAWKLLDPRVRLRQAPDGRTTE